ncbi:MAG: sulfurtransferase [Bacteroidetes bacterium]|nr:sulfurtransferase [Bacteroidota bacterium]
MKTFQKVILFSAIALISVIKVQAADLISAKAFGEALKSNKNLVVIDVNTAENYAKVHVQGAVNIPHQDLYKPGDVKGLIKSPEDLAKIFGSNGVSADKSIVIYDDGSNKYSSRVYWILKYLGASDVKILHKDMDQWKVARIPVTRAATKPAAVTFTPKVNSAIYVSMADVKAKQKNSGTIIIDARSIEQFKGVDEKGESKGHIEGAVNIPYTDLLTDKGAYKSAEQIKQIVSSKGVAKDKEIIVYCNTGIWAAVVYTALNSVLEYPNVKVYDGSYVEWVAGNNPITKN